jgi:hypothetical protein
VGERTVVHDVFSSESAARFRTLSVFIVNGYTDDGARVHIVFGDVVLANGYGSGSLKGEG